MNNSSISSKIPDGVATCKRNQIGLIFRKKKFIVVINSYQYCAGGKIEKNEVGVACGAYGGGERCAQGSGWET